MKKLILPLFFLSFPALADVQEMPSVSDAAIKNRFMTTVKDAEVEKLLGASAEFNDCRTKYNKFDAADDENKRNQKLKEATDCFKEKIGKKDPGSLKKLAEELRLENYGLIKSKSTSDITDYLSKKMIKSLTGRDPDDKNYNNVAWEKRKIVDQKVFIDLYTNQLVKSALFEVSRFCFENLRNGGAGTDFASHWPKSSMKFKQNAKGENVADISGVDDSGNPAFFNSAPTTDMTKKEDAYKEVVKGLGATVDSDTYETYFKFCQSALPQLCEKFRADINLKTKDATGADQSVVSDNLGTNLAANGMSVGANACLTIDRLKSIRNAMANTEKVGKQFEEMGEDKDKFALQMIKNPQIYKRGKGDNEESLDEITTMSSEDMLNESKDDFKNLEQKCSQPGGGSECDSFLVKGDELDKSIHNVESEMNLKREVELEKIRSFQGKPEDLEKYLSDNGHFDLLNKIKDKTLGYDAIEGEISKIYDARKVAEIEALKLKVGKRQLSEKDYNAMEDDDKTAAIIGNIKESKEERARLAQVVMFNNIITSQLSLEEKGTGKQVGRNVNAWKKEAKGLDASGVDMSLFANIQKSADENGSQLEDTSVVGGGIIDSILGKKEDPKK